MSGYAGAAYGGTSGGVSLTSSDGFSISDAAVVGRKAADSWSVTDIVPVRLALVRSVADSFALADSAQPNVGRGRSAADGFTIADGPVRVFWAPYVDLPKRLWIRPATKSLALRPATKPLFTEDAAKALVLEDATKELVLDG